MPYFCYHIDLYTDKGIVLQLRFLGQVLRVVVQRRWVLMFVCRRPFSLNFLLSSKIGSIRELRIILNAQFNRLRAYAPFHHWLWRC